MADSLVLIHGRFAPNGQVVEISERPTALTPQQWFEVLADKASDVYRTLAGGRILFSLTEERLASLKAAISEA